MNHDHQRQLPAVQAPLEKTMPAMGPQINEERLEAMFQDVLQHLCEKYNLGVLKEPLPQSRMIAEHRKEAFAKLREGVEAVYTQDVYEGF